jgi:hypothetical protein
MTCTLCFALATARARASKNQQAALAPKCLAKIKPLEYNQLGYKKHSHSELLLYKNLLMACENVMGAILVYETKSTQ